MDRIIKYIQIFAILFPGLIFSACTPENHTPERIIQYDEGIFGKINIHDLENTPVTTYSPLTFVKRTNYVSQYTQRISIDKGQKHFFKYPEDSLDSRYVYNYIEKDLGLLDTTEDHRSKLENYFKEKIEKEGVAAEPLTKRIALARSYGLEILLNFRINDVHWGGPKPARPELQSEFWLAHPEYYVNPDGTNWKDGAYNFAIPEVQDYLLQYYEEAVNRFDNDGILIDMMRNPTFFPPETGWENREHLTAFMQKVRATLDASQKPGGKRPVIGIRVPTTLAYCEMVGMDIKTWIERELVDFISVSTFIKQDPNLQVDAFRKDLGERSIPLYATVQRRNYGHGYSASSGQFRALVANMYGNQKADGLLLFNFMEETRDDYIGWNNKVYLRGANPELLHEFASLKTLEKRNKVYSIGWGLGDQYPDLPFYHPLPISISSGQSDILQMGIHEQFSQNTPKESILVIQVSQEEAFLLSVNGKEVDPLSSHPVHIPLDRITGLGREDKAVGIHNDRKPRYPYFYSVPKGILFDGMNEIEILVSKSSGTIEVRRADLFISYGSEEECGTY